MARRMWRLHECVRGIAGGVEAMSLVPIGANIVDGLKVHDILARSLGLAAQAGHGFPMTDAISGKYQEQLKAPLL